MEKEKTAVEELQEFAKKSGREIDIVEKRYADEFRVPEPRYRREVYIPDNSQTEVFYAAYSDFKVPIDNGMYSGVFFQIKAPKESNISIRKKNILDKLNIFSGGDFMDDHDFSKKVIIHENDDVVAARILYNTRVQQLLMEAFKIDPRILAGLNDVDLSRIKRVKGESHFGIMIKTQWLMDAEKIEQLFLIVEKLRFEINNS